MIDDAVSTATAAAPTRLETLRTAIGRILPERLVEIPGHTGELTCEVAADSWLAVAAILRDHAELKFDMCMDVRR